MGAPRAARQVAGLDLPTRSVHALRGIRPRTERPVVVVGEAHAARGVFAGTSLLVLGALLFAALGWVARLDRFVLDVPRGTIERLDDLAVGATLASVAGLAVGVVTLAIWCVRRLRSTEGEPTPRR